MKVLLVGGSGLLGRGLVNALPEHRMTVFARNDPHDIGSPSFISGDVLNPESVARAVRGQDAVVNLAGAVALRPSELENARRVNVEGARNVALACREAGIRLVHVSSVAAIGSSDGGGDGSGEVLDERAGPERVRMDFPNARSKTAGEAEVLQLARAGRLDGLVVNPSLCIGAGDGAKAARRGAVLAANGKLRFYPRGGVNVVCIEDAARGIALALGRGKTGERYILGGENLTLQDLLCRYARAAGRREPSWAIPSFALRSMARVAPGVIREALLSSTFFHWYDHGKASRELGYAPGGIGPAIERSARWILENP